MAPPPRQQGYARSAKPSGGGNALLAVGALVAVVLFATVLYDFNDSDVEPPAAEVAETAPAVEEAPAPPPIATPPKSRLTPPKERRVTVEEIRSKGGWSDEPVKIGHNYATEPTISSIYELGSVCTDYQSSHWCLYSQKGDYIGGGRLTERKGSVRVRKSGGGVRVSFGGWHASFAPRKGRTFAEGGYGNARRSRSENFPELSVSGSGRGCNVIMGSFEVTRLVIYGEEVEAFEVLFEQHCEGKPEALFGRICHNCRKELKNDGLLKGIKRSRD